MKRKEKELYWAGQINEYRESGETLVQWCEKKDIKIHTMKYWLRKQSPVSKKSQDRLGLLSGGRTFERYDYVSEIAPLC